MSNKDCGISPEEEKKVVDFLVRFGATIVRIEEGTPLPQPANDNDPETGGFDDAA